MDEIKRDVDNAQRIDEMLLGSGLLGNSSPSSRYTDINDLFLAIREANPGRGAEQIPSDGGQNDLGTVQYEDEKLAWFSSWFKDGPNIEDSVYHVLAWRKYGGRSCFLGDANSLILSADFFTEVVNYIRSKFPILSRFTVYGRTKSAARKGLDDLKAFHDAGLNRIHFGIESGSNRVLSFMMKGETAQDHIDGCRKTSEAGISPSVYIMPGLGGARWTYEHAIETARVLTEAQPDYVRLRTLEIFPGTGLASAMKKGEFMEATEEQVVWEIRTIIEHTDIHAEIVSDSASNLLDVSGRLPDNRSGMLKVIDDYLELPEREKIIFSLSSRLQSFVSQYGHVSGDILDAIKPYVRNGAFDPSRAPNEELQRITRLIRSKLMP